MDYKKAFIDPEIEIGNEFFPDIYNIKIKSHNENLIGTILTATGKGPNPAVILLHGFPGYEDNHDLAHGLRRAGLNVLVFHYRGCWGVKGSFSFENCIEDVKSAIDYLFKEETLKKYLIDKNNVFIVGHSMGGFLTLNCCNDDRIKASVAISPYDFGLKGCVMREDKKELIDGIAMFSSAMDPLNGTNVMTLINETMKNGNNWNLRNKASNLAKEKLLIIAASGDTIGPISLHHIPLINEINKYKNNVKEVIVDTDHSYSNKRIYLTNIVCKYIEGIIKEEAY